jgi:hypothetical protein
MNSGTNENRASNRVSMSVEDMDAAVKWEDLLSHVCKDRRWGRVGSSGVGARAGGLAIVHADQNGCSTSLPSSSDMAAQSRWVFLVAHAQPRQLPELFSIISNRAAMSELAQPGASCQSWSACQLVSCCRCFRAY